MYHSDDYLTFVILRLSSYDPLGPTCWRPYLDAIYQVDGFLNQ